MSMTEKNRILKDISVIDFAMVDLTEYLDTHPFDKKAMEYFNHFANIKSQLMQEFSSKYFPLTKDTSRDTKQWNWGLAPMPWEAAYMEGGCK